jgi:NADH-quinone oxidoreductase subunit N
MAAWAGLGKRSPLVAGAFAFFLLSMAGIPLTSGFVGKWAVFTSAMSAGFWWVVLVAIASSVIAVFFYIRQIRVMFFSEPEPGQTAAVSAPSVLTIGTVAICLAATLVLGVVPGPVLELVVSAGDFIR